MGGQPSSKAQIVCLHALPSLIAVIFLTTSSSGHLVGRIALEVGHTFSTAWNRCNLSTKFHLRQQVVQFWHCICFAKFVKSQVVLFNYRKQGGRPRGCSSIVLFLVLISGSRYVHKNLNCLYTNTTKAAFCQTVAETTVYLPAVMSGTWTGCSVLHTFFSLVKTLVACFWMVLLCSSWIWIGDCDANRLIKAARYGGRNGEPSVGALTAVINFAMDKNHIKLWKQVLCRKWNDNFRTSKGENWILYLSANEHGPVLQQLFVHSPSAHSNHIYCREGDVLGYRIVLAEMKDMRIAVIDIVNHKTDSWSPLCVKKCSANYCLFYWPDAGVT